MYFVHLNKFARPSSGILKLSYKKENQIVVSV